MHIDEKRDRPPLLYKYIGTSGIHRILAASPTLRFTPPDELNDPFELFPISMPLTRTMEAAQRAGFRRLGFDEVNVSNKIPWIDAYNSIGSWISRTVTESLRIGILSLSADSRSNLLWAHYASNFKGIAVGFDFSSTLFSELGVDEYREPAEVNYVEQRVPDAVAWERYAVDPGHPAHYLIKGKDWKYESEYRCFRFLKYTEKRNDASGIVPFDRSHIRKVIVGINLIIDDKIEAKDADARIKLLDRWTRLAPSVPLYVAVPHPERFEVVISLSPPIKQLKKLADFRRSKRR